MSTQTQLYIGRKYRFRLGADPDAVQLSGSVRWCRLSGTERQESGDIVPVYEAGISFDDVWTDKAEELLEFMEKTIILDVKNRISGRFKVESEGPVELESESEFEVKQLSLSGMMIESEAGLVNDTVVDLDMLLADREFTAEARVIYMSEMEFEEDAERQQDEARPVYRMGIEFVRVSESNRDVLEHFIRNELNQDEKHSRKES